MYEQFYEDNIKDARMSGDQIYGLCPFHDDRKASLSANVISGLWKCHGCEAKGNAPQFAERLSIDPPKQIYVYQDEQGNPLFRVTRSHPKRFSQERFENGRWISGLNGTRRLLYRLPDIADQSEVWIVEGEKDAERLWRLGIPATCNPGGAGKWSDEFSPALREKEIIILPDHDDSGRNHASRVAKSLIDVAKSVKLVNLPGLLPKGDVSDWLDQGHSKEELIELVKASCLLTAEQLNASTSDAGVPSLPVELQNRRIHPALHIESDFTSVGVIQLTDGKPKYSIRTSTGGLYEVESVLDRLTTPHIVYPDLVDRWVPAIGPLSLDSSVGLLIRKMRELVSFGDERWYSAAALWAAGTYLFPAFPAFPYFQLTGEKGSGKTKIQDIFKCVCFNAIKVVNPTPAVLFRIVSSLRPTLLIDEAERMNSEEAGTIQSILNTGYKPGSSVIRVVGESFQLQFFDVYSPKSFASINSLGSVTEDRCITAVMSRPPKVDPRQNRNVDPKDPEWTRIRNGFYELPFSYGNMAFGELDSLSLPEWLLARERELWTPIFWLASQADPAGNLGLYEDVTGLAREMQKNKGMDFDLETVLALLEEKLGEASVAKVRPGELVEELEKRLHRKIEPGWVGQKFRTLGLTQRHRDGRGQVYDIAAEQIQDIRARYAS